MDQTPREKWAEYLGLAASIIPAMIATGFMPAWDVLPHGVWLAIATVGCGIAGAIATPLRRRGLISGLVGGAGIFAGIWLVTIFMNTINNHKILRYELAIGAVIGGIPGLILYYMWARPRAERASSASA